MTLHLHVLHLKPIKQNAATPEGEQDPEQTQCSPSSGTDQPRVQTLHKAVPDITDILPEGEGSSRVSGLLICRATSTAHDGLDSKSVYI